jgi:hypothetical protein
VQLSDVVLLWYVRTHHHHCISFVQQCIGQHTFPLEK